VPVYEKCKVFTCSHACNMHVIIDSVAMSLNLPLLYVVWLEEYFQISPNKNKSPNLWHVTSILVCCIFECALCQAKVGKVRFDWQFFITSPLYDLLRNEQKMALLLSNEPYQNILKRLWNDKQNISSSGFQNVDSTKQSF
jgi:hypothetical protein